ncbi:hypothetical protein KM043_002469 [Ampulex compressa]|nr:hypothetical protein KM043_002469 [Ampulex compressa]
MTKSLLTSDPIGAVRLFAKARALDSFRRAKLIVDDLAVCFHVPWEPQLGFTGPEWRNSPDALFAIRYSATGNRSSGRIRNVESVSRASPPAMRVSLELTK